MKNKLTDILKKLDVPGGVWMTLFSLMVLAICIHAYLSGKNIPTEIVTVYGLVLGAFATSKTIQHFKGDE